MSPRRWLVVILSFALALGVSAWVLVSGWRHGGGAFTLPGPAHIAALVITAVEILARGVKLRWIARAIGFRLALRPALRTVLGGDFGGAITPSRSGSEPARFLILTEARVGAANIVLLLFAELALEAASLAIVAFGLAFVFPRGGGALAGVVGVVGGYAAFVLAAMAIGALLARRHGAGPVPHWASALGIGTDRWRAVQRSLRQLRDGVRAAASADRRWVTGALVVSVLHIAARIAVLPALVRFADPAVPLAPLVLWPLMLLYGAAVAPAPGGGGVIEVAYRATLGDVIPQALLGTTLVWWRFYTFYLPMLLGAVVAGRAVLRAMRDRPARGRRHAARSVATPRPDV